MNLPRFVLRILLGRRLPITSGELEIEGLSHPISIRRDKFGVPYIEAETDNDAMYALGFCQGQDRAFQLEMLLRSTRGTLAELVGEVALPLDRLSRRVGLHRYAKNHVQRLEPQVHQIVKAFAKGISEGACLGCRKPAHEFALLKTKPTPYQVVDVLANMNYMAFMLSSWTAKLGRLKLLREGGHGILKSLDSDYGDWIPVTSPVGMPSGPVMDRLTEDLSKLGGLFGSGGASNHWALNSTRTGTGRPILANDPHLAPSIPPPWYLAHIRTPAGAVAGASFIGLPLIPCGHNDVAAWGVTAGLADNTDLFIEELGDDGFMVKDGDHYIPCEIIKERIVVKGDDPFEEDMFITPRGPIISDLMEGEVGAISICATWMRQQSIGGFSNFHHAKSFQDFHKALKEMQVVSLNMAYADTSDSIGWQLAGAVPQRRGGWGIIPLPGWDQDSLWESELIPFARMPFLSDPETGFVATANNKPTQDGDGPYLGSDWADGYRLARIVELLDKRHDWQPGDMPSMQMDQFSIPWREMREVVLAVPGEKTEVKQALSLLHEWDGIVAADSSAAAVYELFVAEMVSRIAELKAGGLRDWALGKGFHAMIPRSYFGMRYVSYLVELLREKPEGWLKQSWEVEISDALTRAMRSLKEKHGPSPDNWAWGRIRQLTLTHPIGSRRPLDKIFNLGPFPWGGDGQTVSQAGRQLMEPTANPTTIANLRMTLDVGNWDENQFVLAGGQSGNPLSPHYAVLLPLWKVGAGINLAWSLEEINRVAKATLRLIPDPDKSRR